MSQPGSFGAQRGSELTAALVDKVAHIRELNAEVLDLLAIMDTEHVASDAGYSSLAAYVSEATHMSRGAARQWVARAAHLAERITPTGHVTPAALPHTREVMHEGVLDTDHLDAIVEVVKQLPASAPSGLRELFDQTLADRPSEQSQTVKRHGQQMLRRLNQDGTLPPDEKTATGTSCTYSAPATAAARSGVDSTKPPPKSGWQSSVRWPSRSHRCRGCRILVQRPSATRRACGDGASGRKWG